MLEQYFALSSVLGVEWHDGWMLVPSPTLPTLSFLWTSFMPICRTSALLLPSWPEWAVMTAWFRPQSFDAWDRAASFKYMLRRRVGTRSLDQRFLRFPVPFASHLCRLSIDAKWVKNITSPYNPPSSCQVRARDGERCGRLVVTATGPNSVLPAVKANNSKLYTRTH